MATSSTSTAPPLSLAVIIASVRDGRFGPVVARWFVEQTTHRPDLAVRVVFAELHAVTAREDRQLPYGTRPVRRGRPNRTTRRARRPRPRHCSTS